MIDANHQLDAVLDDLRSVVDTDIAERESDISTTRERMDVVFIGVLLVGVVTGGALAAWIARAIVRRLGRTVDVLEDVAVAVSTGAWRSTPPTRSAGWAPRSTRRWAGSGR